jgi:NADP-dependent 3-hydroxy acid dehydrogenase YdfG
MIREKALLKLLADDLRALRASALALEKDMQRLSQEIDSYDLDSLARLVSQMNAAAFAPIEALMADAGVSLSGPAEQRNASDGVLAEVRVQTMTGRANGATAISAIRRAARYMEMYCSSIADSAKRLRLNRLAGHVQAWAREWIGFELTLNAVAARPRQRETASAAA